MSDWYKGKIIPTDLALASLGIELPETLEVDGQKYIKRINGYVREDCKDDRDVKRGLYMQFRAFWTRDCYLQSNRNMVI